MKKLFLLAFLAVGMTANAETITVSNSGEIENKGGIELGKGKDENDRWSMHIAVGVDIPTGAPDGVDFSPFRSWEINWTVLQYDYSPKNMNTTFSAGLGFGWRSYTLKGHDKMFYKDGSVVKVATPAPKRDELSSNIHTTSISLPLLVKQKFSKDFAVSVGAQLNWNYFGRLHTYYEQGNDEIDVSTKSMGERPITVDVLGIVHLGNLGIYCKYSPMSVLKSDRGPEFKSLSVGVYF